MIQSSWKSSPLIEEHPNPKRSSKQSQRSSIHRESQ